MALTKISEGGVKDDAASQAKIADEAIDEARLQVSNAGSNGQFLQKQSGNSGGLTWATVDTNLSSDTSPQLGGNLDVNAKNIILGDSSDGTGDDVIKFGADTDLSIYSNGTEGIFTIPDAGTLKIKQGTSDLATFSGSSNQIDFHEDVILIGAGSNAFWDKSADTFNSPILNATSRVHISGSAGTSGHVLTSGGSGGAPSWAAVPAGGNSVDLVADGAIAAGKPCIIKSNGKAQQAQLVQTGKDSVDFSNTPSGSTGTTFTDQGVHGGESRLAYDPITKKIVLITKGVSAGDTYYQIGTENSSNNQTIDWTTKVELWGDNENNYYETSDLVYAGNSRFLYIWTLNSGVSKVKIGKATSSGFSWSNALDLYENDSMFKGFNSVKLTDDRVAIQANALDADGPWDEDRSGILIIDITSDTTIAYRNFTQLDTDTTKRVKENNTLSYDTTNGILFATWETDGGTGRCCALKVAAGTSATITKSSSNVQIDTTISEQDACYHAGQDKFLIAYQGEVGVNPGIEVKVATVNSTSLAVTLADGATLGQTPHRGLKINEGVDDQIYMTHVRSDNKMYTAVSTNFSGGSFTFASPADGREVATTFSGAWYYFEQIFIPDFGTAKNLLVMSGGGSSDYSSWYTYKTSSEQTNLTAHNVIGFAPSAISDGNTGTINTDGNTVTTSGLTAGTRYWVADAGGFQTSVGNTQAGGVALSSTKLLIKMSG